MNPSREAAACLFNITYPVRLYLLLLVFLNLCSLPCKGTDAFAPEVKLLLGSPARDTTSLRAEQLDRITSTPLFRATYVAVPLIGVGQVARIQDQRFRQLRNDYLSSFSHHLDDYLQYAPAAALLSMKLGGVEGHSDWGRMLTAHAFSVAITAATINSLKYTTKVIRPDGSTQNSFPSGHTATAFMTATMFNKEYGSKYPWLGLTSYAAASTTGLMRISNNRHWLSDVLTGAGIGILSTEMGYFLSDLIMGHNPKRRTDSEQLPERHNPSFLALYMGVNAPLQRYNAKHKVSFQTAAGATAGLEGAYFMHRNLGVGARFTASNIRVLMKGKQQEDMDAADLLTFCAGAYVSAPISRRWEVGTKLLAGIAHYPKIELGSFRHEGHRGCCLGTGLSLTYQQTTHFGMRFSIDYDQHPSSIRRYGHINHWLTFGGSAIYLF